MLILEGRGNIKATEKHNIILLIWLISRGWPQWESQHGTFYWDSPERYGNTVDSVKKKAANHDWFKFDQVSFSMILENCLLYSRQCWVVKRGTKTLGANNGPFTDHFRHGSLKIIENIFEYRSRSWSIFYRQMIANQLSGSITNQVHKVLSSVKQIWSTLKHSFISCHVISYSLFVYNSLRSLRTTWQKRHLI